MSLAIKYALQKRSNKSGVKPNAAAIAEDDRELNQHGAIEQGPQGGMYAKGGVVEEGMQSDAHMLDMVGRIIKQRQQMFSEGGKVANDVGIAEADKLPAEYDDLVLRDDLEEHYTGANSGDELGNAQEDKDRKDIVARIMRSREKKDKMLRPA